jgi:hypothetical protein
VKLDVPVLTNLRLDPYERTGFAGSCSYPAGLHLSSGVSCSCRRKWREPLNLPGVPANAEGRELQFAAAQGRARKEDGGTRQSVEFPAKS